MYHTTQALNLNFDLFDLVTSDEPDLTPGHQKLNPSPDGAFPDPARRWGGGRFTPLAICQTTGLVVDPKTEFDTSGLELPECVAKFCLNVTDDITGRVMGPIIDYLSLTASPGKAPVSN